MKKNNFGRLIFISSRALVGLETRTAYSYSKAGIIGMARTWALELASSGITVNSIAPGPVLTDQFWALVEKDGEQQKKIAESIPVGRIGEPEDVARTVMFFSNPDNSFITGQTLFVLSGDTFERCRKLAVEGAAMDKESMEEISEDSEPDHANSGKKYDLYDESLQAA